MPTGTEKYKLEIDNSDAIRKIKEVIAELLKIGKEQSGFKQKLDRGLDLDKGERERLNTITSRKLALLEEKKQLEDVKKLNKQVQKQFLFDDAKTAMSQAKNIKQREKAIADFQKASTRNIKKKAEAGKPEDYLFDQKVLQEEQLRSLRKQSTQATMKEVDAQRTKEAKIQAERVRAIDKAVAQQKASSFEMEKIGYRGQVGAFKRGIGRDSFPASNISSKEFESYAFEQMESRGALQGLKEEIEYQRNSNAGRLSGIKSQKEKNRLQEVITKQTKDLAKIEGQIANTNVWQRQAASLGIMKDKLERVSFAMQSITQVAMGVGLNLLFLVRMPMEQFKKAVEEAAGEFGKFELMAKNMANMNIAQGMGGVTDFVNMFGDSLLSVSERIEAFSVEAKLGMGSMGKDMQKEFANAMGKMKDIAGTSNQDIYNAMMGGSEDITKLMQGTFGIKMAKEMGYYNQKEVDDAKELLDIDKELYALDKKRKKEVGGRVTFTTFEKDGLQHIVTLTERKSALDDEDAKKTKLDDRKKEIQRRKEIEQREKEIRMMTGEPIAKEEDYKKFTDAIGKLKEESFAVNKSREDAIKANTEMLRLINAYAKSKGFPAPYADISPTGKPGETTPTAWDEVKTWLTKISDILEKTLGMKLDEIVMGLMILPGLFSGLTAGAALVSGNKTLKELKDMSSLGSVGWLPQGGNMPTDPKARATWMKYQENVSKGSEELAKAKKRGENIASTEMNLIKAKEEQLVATQKATKKTNSLSKSIVGLIGGIIAFEIVVRSISLLITNFQNRENEKKEAMAERGNLDSYEAHRDVKAQVLAGRDLGTGKMNKPIGAQREAYMAAARLKGGAKMAEIAMRGENEMDVIYNMIREKHFSDLPKEEGLQKAREMYARVIDIREKQYETERKGIAVLDANKYIKDLENAGVDGDKAKEIVSRAPKTEIDKIINAYKKRREEIEMIGKIAKKQGITGTGIYGTGSEEYIKTKQEFIDKYTGDDYGLKPVQRVKPVQGVKPVSRRQAIPRDINKRQGIPRFAMGGLLDRPTNIIAGERPEAIIPLDGGQVPVMIKSIPQVQQQPTLDIRTIENLVDSKSGSQYNITVNFPNYIGDKTAIITQLTNQIKLEIERTKPISFVEKSR